MRPERRRKYTRLTACTSTTPHNAATIDSSSRVEPAATIGGMPWSMPRCTNSGTDSLAAFSSTMTIDSSATVVA